MSQRGAPEFPALGEHGVCSRGCARKRTVSLPSSPYTHRYTDSLWYTRIGPRASATLDAKPGYANKGVRALGGFSPLVHITRYADGWLDAISMPVDGLAFVATSNVAQRRATRGMRQQAARVSWGPVYQRVAPCGRAPDLCGKYNQFHKGSGPKTPALPVPALCLSAGSRWPKTGASRSPSEPGRTKDGLRTAQKALERCQVPPCPCGPSGPT